MNAKTLRKTTLPLFAVLIALLVVSTATAITTDVFYEDNTKQKTIAPGEEPGYYITVVTSNSGTDRNVSAKLYDTTGSQTELLGEIFYEEFTDTIYFSPVLFIENTDYEGLPGDYLLDVKGAETLSGTRLIDSDQLSLEVEGNRLPTTSFMFTPENPTTDDTVTFTSEASDDDGEIVSYAWDFNGDGVTDSTAENPSYQYTAPGTYTASLTVTDNDGATGTATETVPVEQGEIPSLTLEYVNCNDYVVQGEQQYCTAQVTSDGEGVSNAEVTVEYVDGETLETCTTNQDGYCNVEPTITKAPGDYTVTGTATKTGFEADLTRTAEDTFTVLEQRYDVTNLRTWEDEYLTEQYTFYRGNQVWTSFDIIDLTTGEVLHPTTDDIITEVSLTVNQPENTAKTMSSTDPISLIEVPNPDKSDDPLVGAYRYTLPSIPLTDDYLGYGKVFAFAINIENAEGGQESVTVDLLNNELTFQDPGRITINEGETKTLDLNAYVDDLETPSSEILYTADETGSMQVTQTTNGVFDVTAPTSYSGVQTVFFTADDTDGSTKTEDVIYEVLQDNEAPIPVITYEDKTYTVGDTIEFLSESYDPDGEIVSTSWYWDEEFFGSTQSIQRELVTPGEHEVKLVVRDDDGASAETTETITVNEVPNEQPIADFNYDPQSPETGEQVLFESTSFDNDGQIVAYEWFIEGTNVGGGVNYNHVFETSGCRDVMLRVEDDDGATDDRTKEVCVSQAPPPNQDPDASFTYTPSEPVEDQTVTFTSTSTDPDGDDLQESWDLDGDGFVDKTGEEVTFTYSEPGTYLVTLQVEDGRGGEDTTTQEVLIRTANEAPDASFTYDPENPTAADTIDFQSTSTDSDGTISAYQWRIDGSVVNNQEAFSTQLSTGTYDVTLRVTDNDGASDTATQTVTVTEEPNEAPEASFEFDPESPTSEDTIAFTSTSTDSDGTISAYQWRIDGSVMSTSENFDTQLEAGTYDVNLRVTDDDGASDEATQTITVSEPTNQAPEASFTFEPENPTAEDIIEFTSTSTDTDGQIVSSEWYIDGELTSINEAFVTQLEAGTYTMELVVEDDDGATDSTSQIITVSEAPNEAPTANFEFEPQAPQVNDDVTFTSTSTDADGDIVAYEWRIDGSVVSTSESFEETFTAADTYTVSLTVTDDDGATDTEHKTVTVTEEPNEAPTASFTFQPDPPMATETVTFTSTSTDTDGTIEAYEWVIDGTTVSTAEQFQTTFEEAGQVTVSLTVTDDDGAMDTATQTITVGEAPNEAPDASFTFDPENPTTEDTVAFTSTSTDSDGTISAYQWQIDGAVVSTAESFEETFNAPGTYEVTLIVEDNNGASDITTQTVQVTEPANEAPEASFEFSPENPIVDQEVDFTSTSTDADGSIVSYEWLVNGVLQSTTEDFTEVFSSPGTYTVKLVVEDDDGATDSTSQTITVGEAQNQPPSASFEFEPTSPTVTETVRFTSTSTDADGTIVSYEWRIDGTTVSTAPSFERVFNQPGTYTVQLEVMDNDGATDIATQTISVGEEPNEAPEASFEFDPESPTSEDTIAFTSTSTDSDGEIVTYQWAIDGMIQSTAPSFTTQLEAGTYTVELLVIDDEGASDGATQTITVSEPANKDPTALFDYNPENPFVDELVDFISLSTDPDGDELTAAWDFDGDGVIDATGDTPSFTYDSAGTYRVTLRVEDGRGGSDEATTFITVQPLPNNAPTASFEFSPENPVTDETVTFTSTSTDTDGVIEDFKWFVDGTLVSTQEDFNYVFTEPGTYTVQHKVTDNDGASDTATQTITVGAANQAPEASFEFDPENPTSEDTVAFTSTSKDVDGEIVSYEWSVDGSVVSTAESFEETFEPGTYIVSLTVTDDDGATDTATQTVTVSEPANRAPTASFLFSPENPVSPADVTFTSTSTDADGAIVGYEWSINGELVNTNDAFTATLTEGTYTVQLVVEDDDGATDTATQTIVVAPEPNNAPDASFEFSPENPRAEQNVSFTSTSTDSDGDIVSYAWDFNGDGTTDSTEENPIHVFQEQGTYTVSLTVTDDDGATDTATQTIGVSQALDAPIAVLSAPRSIFEDTNTTLDGSGSFDPDGTIESYRWTLKRNGATILTTTTSEETYQYDFPDQGNHVVELTVTDNDGLTGTATARIDVAKTKAEQRRLQEEVAFDSIAVYGEDFGVIQNGEPYTVTAQVSNGGRSSVEELRLGFEIPEYGYQRRGQTTTINSDDSVSLTLNDVLIDVPPGDYYAYVTVTGGDTHERNIFPITVEE